MEKIYWIGPRESDIEAIESIFAGSVTIYGSNRGKNRSYCQSNTERINHNIHNDACDNFIQAELKNLIHKDNSVQFLFYNPLLAYDFDPEIVSHSICVNRHELLTQLHDKARCRVILQQTVKTIPFVTLSGTECTPNSLGDYFTSEEFVIQDIFSSGGEGTIHVKKSEALSLINPIKHYLVSPYIENSISINTHIVVGTENICFFPPSVQIIKEVEHRLLYYGADYICYTTVDHKIQDEVKRTSIKIGNKLQAEGYRGILGIDFLLSEDTLYFVELNPRFQASSQLINIAMKSAHHISLQELHMLSFRNPNFEYLPEFTVPFSNYVFTTSNIHANRIPKVISSPEITFLQKDGFKLDRELPSQKNIYLFRCVFDTNISSISKNMLRLHPNIYTKDIEPYLQPCHEFYRPNVKIALLNHGVTLTPQAMAYAQKCGTIRKAVFDAIDIVVFESLYVNVPFRCKFCTISPFSIDIEDEKFLLLYDGLYVSEVIISFVPEPLLNKKTMSGVPFDHIINLANDRIRINPASVCIFKKQNTSCKFCNLPTENSSYGIDDIKEAIDYCLGNIRFRHFLIGGGTYSIQGGWDIIIEIATYIRSKSDKNIYLMSIPPQTTEILIDLYNAGITEVAFNMEIFDRKCALQIMPGKGSISENVYMSALDAAVKIWGDRGNVRSLLIYGFDLWDDFLKGVKNLCKKGVEPIISIFRPLKGTALENLNPPPTLELFFLFQKCQHIVHEHNLILGPDCIECQNNTLSYTET